MVSIRLVPVALVVAVLGVGCGQRSSGAGEATDISGSTGGDDLDNTLHNDRRDGGDHDRG